MMKTLIHNYEERSGYNDEHHYYLVFDEESGALAVEYLEKRFGPRAGDGRKKRYTFAELKRLEPQVYKIAMTLIKTKLFPE